MNIRRTEKITYGLLQIYVYRINQTCYKDKDIQDY